MERTEKKEPVHFLKLKMEPRMASFRLLYIAASLFYLANGFSTQAFYGNSLQKKISMLPLPPSTQGPHEVHTKILGTSCRRHNTQLRSLISIHDYWSIWAVIASCAAAALGLERTAVGRSLSSPVCAMALAVIATNVGLLPTSTSIHVTNLMAFVVKLATPLLLLGADLRKIIRDTGALMKAFVVGTLGTLIGSTFSFVVFANTISSLGAVGDSWKVASAITAKNIGGGLNFMAVANAFGTTPKALGIGLAVDNVMGLFYFPFVSYLGTFAAPEELVAETKDEVVSVNDSEGNNGKGLNDLEKFVGALSVALSIAAISEQLSNHYGLVSTATSTFLTVFLATLFPRFLSPLAQSGDLLGRLLLMLFFGGIGNASGSIAEALAAPATLGVLAFGITLYIVHLVFILVVGRLLRIPLKDSLIASNANIGNAATASAFAASKGWTSSVMPAFLVGTMGNVVATFVALSLGANVLKPIASSVGGL